MSDYGFEFLKMIDVPNIPNNLQGNGEQIKPRLRQYILNGEPCEYNENIRQKLKKFTGNERIKYIALIFFSVFTAFCFIRKFAEENTKSMAEAAMLMFIPLAVAVVIITVFILKIYFGSIALRLADKGRARCFKYKLHGRLRYVLDACEGDYLYYADLGDFCVNISESADLDFTVTGIVVNIKGTEHFYLLVERFALTL